ncbi:glycosyltransferase family 61 protein, partial [Peribacillus frigoritolerans]|uniref:glycosyltransferase family 61 protein n=1 Tax=Peribacillus frigoritolerans TaxID=450367 RepID=UPI00339A6D1F
IPDGRVITGNCYSVTPNNKRMRDTELNYPTELKNLPPAEYTAESVANLIWGYNLPEINFFTHGIYGHWFFDILPRIHLLEKSGIAIDKYLIGKLNHPFQYESLQMLNFPMHKLIQVEKHDFHLVADKLLVPAVPFMLGGTPKWAFQYIREKLMDENNDKVEGYERIYISRQDASYRFVNNEDEVMEVLKNKGFKRIVLTPLTTQEKISLFSSAKVIVAPFGSGSANIVFCDPGTKLIELSPKHVIDPYFWILSSQGNLEYYELVCDIENPPKPTAASDNIVVDIDKLKQILAMIGI